MYLNCATDIFSVKEPRVSSATQAHCNLWSSTVPVYFIFDDFAFRRHFIVEQTAITEIQQIADRSVCVGLYSGCSVVQPVSRAPNFSCRISSTQGLPTASGITLFSAACLLPISSLVFVVSFSSRALYSLGKSDHASSSALLP